MTIKLNNFGKLGTLTAVTSSAPWSRCEFNGLSLAPPVDPATLGDRIKLMTDDNGDQFYRLRRHTTDTLQGSPGRVRIEMSPSTSLDAEMADWEGDGEIIGGDPADANNAKWWYRFAVRLYESTFPTDYMTQLASSPFQILMQMFPRLDTADGDEDTVGSPVLALRVKSTAEGIRRMCFTRNNDPDETSTVFVEAVHNQEIVSFPFNWGEWNDFLIYVNWSWTTLGEMTIWRNRRLLYTETGVGNCMNNAPSRGGGRIKPKFGLYTGPGSLSGVNDFTVDHMGFLMGDYESSFQEMHPEHAYATARRSLIAYRGAA